MENTIRVEEVPGARQAKYVVVDEKALGVILNADVQVLASHSMHIDCPGVYPAPMGGRRMRNALPKDFERFRVMPPPELRVAFEAIARKAKALTDDGRKMLHNAANGGYLYDGFDFAPGVKEVDSPAYRAMEGLIEAGLLDDAGRVTDAGREAVS